MGDWAKVLEVIDSENAETAANGEGAACDTNDERLFLREDGWDGPKFLRCSQRRQPPLRKCPDGRALRSVAMLLA